MLKAVEDAMIGRLEAIIGAKSQRPIVRVIETLPAQLDEAELERRLRAAPGAYVAFLGGEARKSSQLIFDANFAVYVLTSSASETQRRRGGSAQAGAYPILLLAAAALNGFKVPDVGSLYVVGMDNLFAEALDAKGAALYALRCQIPIAPPNIANPDDLDDFLRFHADWLFDKDAPAPPVTLPLDDADVAEDVTLPAA